MSSSFSALKHASLFLLVILIKCLCIFRVIDLGSECYWIICDIGNINLGKIMHFKAGYPTFLLRAQRRIVGHWFNAARASSLTGWYLPLLAGGKSGLLPSAGSRGERNTPDLVMS